jgi:[acyl-carrier-protein] S-malonyltransferase
MPPASSLSTHLDGILRAAPADTSLAILFPGQGSHQVGAGRDLCDSFPSAREVFHRCDEALRLPLSQLCFQGPEELLRDTANAQPAILAVSLACLAAGLESGALQRRPAFMAGHSLGEFTALVAAGALDLEDAVSLVGTRGRLMAEASRRQPGTMTAIIGLDDQAVDEVCHRSGAQPCNYNSPSQAVIGGSLAAVEEASSLAREHGGRAMPLNVSGAFHTSLMAPAAEEFAAAVDLCPIGDPSIPVVANSSAEPLTTAAAVRQELRRQIIRPVLWHRSVLRMLSVGVTNFIETGPGRVLSGLVKRTGPGLTAVSLDSVDSLDALRHV